jgi:hypothetical protein
MAALHLNLIIVGSSPEGKAVCVAMYVVVYVFTLLKYKQCNHNWYNRLQTEVNTGPRRNSLSATGCPKIYMTINNIHIDIQ